MKTIVKLFSYLTAFKALPLSTIYNYFVLVLVGLLVFVCLSNKELRQASKYDKLLLDNASQSLALCEANVGVLKNNNYALNGAIESLIGGTGKIDDEFYNIESEWDSLRRGGYIEQGVEEVKTFSFIDPADANSVDLSKHFRLLDKAYCTAKGDC